MIDPNRFEYMRQRLQERVKPSRYVHSMGVSQAAEQLARIYGVDENDAAVAGLLHDWDKALSFKELRKAAKKYTKVPKSVRKNIPGVLHAYTAPHSLKKEFPELSDQVLQAIERHTCAAPEMTGLDMVLFVADIIEPGRTFGDVAPLRDAVGKVSLEELFYMTFKSTLVYLLEADKTIHPESLSTWNAWVKRRQESEGGCFGSAPEFASESAAEGAAPQEPADKDGAAGGEAGAACAQESFAAREDAVSTPAGADANAAAEAAASGPATPVRRPNGARIITIE